LYKTFSKTNQIRNPTTTTTTIIIVVALSPVSSGNVDDLSLLLGVLVLSVGNDSIAKQQRQINYTNIKKYEKTAILQPEARGGKGVGACVGGVGITVTVITSTLLKTFFFMLLNWNDNRIFVIT
jgi:hypothetical protein